MWQPQPQWQVMPGGGGSSTVGLWRATEQGRDVVVKRLAAPNEDDPSDLSDPSRFGYWRRDAEAALSGLVDRSEGLRGPAALRVEEDETGITIVYEKVADAANTGLFVAGNLARFAATDLGDAPWLTRDLLRSRLTRVARRGGWTTLARTTVADVADHLWRRREGLLDRLDALPQVAQHGDPVPGNLPGRIADHVIAIDWSGLGLGPVGADLGFFSLSAREDFETLLGAYADALASGSATHEQIRLGALVTAVFTVLTRADWALARVADGEGALAGKFRHPSVAPYLRAMQRQARQIEALLEV